MKKGILYALLVLLLAVMTACGSDDTTTPPVEDVEPIEEEANEDVEVEVEVEETEAAESTSDLDDNGEFEDEEFGKMKAIGVGLNEDLGINSTGDPVTPIEFGPMNLYINGVGIVDVEPVEDMKFMFNDQDKVRAVIVDMIAENTSDEDISFHPNQAVIVTDTGEQVESEMFFMGEAGGDFLGKVTKEGQTWWLLKNLDQDVKSLRIIISAPHSTDDWEDIGEEQRIEFEIVSWEEANN